MHNNLFMNGHNKSQVKQGMCADQKRDSGTLKVLDVVFGISVLVLVRDLPVIDAVAIFVGAFAAISGMRYFVDQSVRNYYLHRLDWDEQSE